MEYLYLTYPKCTTCQKAKKWLDENNINYIERNIKEQNPNFKELVEWHNKTTLALKKFFNTSGMIYRSMNLAKKLELMSQKEQYELLATDGMLVKRPIIVGNNIVLLGFKADEWEKLK